MGKVLQKNVKMDTFSMSRKLKGPLKVLPPDNDNYELDACSILCLQSNPPLIVIATLSGTLQHLALLQDEQVPLQDQAFIWKPFLFIIKSDFSDLIDVRCPLSLLFYDVVVSVSPYVACTVSLNLV